MTVLVVMIGAVILMAIAMKGMMKVVVIMLR